MTWLAVAALVAGCAYLQRRQRETPAEAEAIKQAWLKSYAKLTGGVA